MLTRIRSFLSWTPLMWATGSAVDQLRTAALPDFQKIKWFFKRFIHLFTMFFYFTENLRVEYGWKTVLVFFFWKKNLISYMLKIKKSECFINEFACYTWNRCLMSNKEVRCNLSVRLLCRVVLCLKSFLSLNHS